ncbi:MAG: hypothetical protein Q8M94_10220, partial [Ignavibacteria bacterium]|nr:hypothetical protein [Ignavibacteria bacterium]
IAQSEDTSFIPELLKLDLMKYGSEVCFAIAQIGSCNQSINFLWNYLNTSPPTNQFPKIFFAIGKIGNETDLNKLVEFYNSFDGPIFPYEGISEAILQFQIRGIKSEDAKLILENEILHTLSSRTRIAKALFALARYNSSNVVVEKLKNILLDTNSIKSQNLEDIDSLNLLKLESIQYALMNFQKLKFFPIELNFLKRVFSNDDILLYIELAKTIIYFDFEQKNTNLLPTVFKILDEPNINVAIQGAISIRDIDSISLNKRKDFVRRRILETLSDYKKYDNLKSKVFLTGYKILGNYKEFSHFINWFNANDILKIDFAALNPDTTQAINNLLKFYHSKELKNRIEALTQLLNFSTNKKFSGEFSQIIFDA